MKIKSPIRLARIVLASITLFAIALLWSCGGDDAGSGGSTTDDGSGGTTNDSGSERSTTLVGSSAIPGVNPASPMWILVQGIDGSTWGRGATAVDGTFSIPLTVPAGGTRALVGAVDPSNPERYALSVIDLQPNTVSAELFSGEVARLGVSSKADTLPQTVRTRLDADSTADAVVRQMSGAINDPVPVLGPAELAGISALSDELGIDPPDLCSVGPSEIAILADVPISPGGGDFFDAVAQGDGDLMSRLREVQQRISTRVASFNKFNVDRNFWLNGPGAFLGVAATRIAVKARTSLSITGFGKDRISIDELKAAADLIFDAGFGNCREKGLTGAFAATSFSEFRQVAAVSVDSTTFNGTHSIAIACTGGSSVFDLSTYDDIKGDVAPDAIFDADCYVIDPWLDETVPLTREYVREKGWTDVPVVMIVDSRTSPSGPSTGGADVCVVNNDTSPDPCDAFVIPDEFLATPPPGPVTGGNLLGGCMDDGLLVCDTLFGADISGPLFEEACEGGGNTWIDGPCPEANSFGACTLFAGNDLAQRIFVFYNNPELTSAEQAEEVSDQRASCIGQSPQGGGPGIWTAPYREP